MTKKASRVLKIPNTRVWYAAEFPRGRTKLKAGFENASVWGFLTLSGRPLVG